MNIDVRNIDEDWIDAIEKIKINTDGINTNAKAVRFATIRYIENQGLINSLNQEIEKLKQIIENNKGANEKVKLFFQIQKELKKEFT